MATCPSCGVSSRAEPDAISIESVLIAKPLGTWSLAGQQMKASAYETLRMTCTRCGWHIDGRLLGDGFYGVPDTQVFPPASGDEA